MFSYLLYLLLLSNCLCLKLDLIDDYFVEAYIGDKKTKFKLLIDPTYPFTYLFKYYRSKTKKNSELKPLLFSNLFGNYSGKWSRDTFFFKEENITIEMKYLDIYYKKENILNVDGVLGLGAYIKQDSNIYYNINQTYHNCFNKITTYDRKNKKIIICDSDSSTKSNKLEINFSYNTFNYPGLIPITKLNLILNKKEIELNDEAYVGLIPLLVPPNEINKMIEESYFDSEDPVNKNRENNWTQIAIEKLYYEIYFDEKKYSYNYDENLDLNSIKKYLDLEDFVDSIVKIKNKWYFGFDQKNIERVEFDFDKGNINLFVYSFKYIIIRVTLFILVLGFFIYAFIIVFQKRKDKNQKNETEQELIDM